MFKLIRVDAFYTISDPKLFKMYAKIDPKWGMGRPLEVNMFQMEPSGPQGRPGSPKGGQSTARWSQERPQGAPGDLQKSSWGPPEGPKGAQEGPG